MLKRFGLEELDNNRIILLIFEEDFFDIKTGISGGVEGKLSREGALEKPLMAMRIQFGVR